MNNQEQMEAYARDMLTSYWMQSQQPQQPQQPQQTFMAAPPPTMAMSSMPFPYSPMQADPMQSWLHQQLYQPASPPMSDVSSPSPQYYQGNKTATSQQQLPTPTPSPPTALKQQDQAHEQKKQAKSHPIQADSTFWEPRETTKSPAKKKIPWWKKSYQPKRSSVIRSNETSKKAKSDTSTPKTTASASQQQQLQAQSSPSPQPQPQQATNSIASPPPPPTPAAAENHQTIQTPFSSLPIPSQQSGFFVYYTPPPPPPPAPVMPEPEKPKERKTTMANPREDTNDRCLIM